MKTALVTGATSGYGAATAKAFLAAGWKVIGTGRRRDRFDALKAEFGPDNFHDAIFDIRDEGARNSALDSVPESFARIDCLVNNAGLALGTEPAQKSNIDDWKVMIDTNVTALVGMTHRFLPQLIANKGSIINLSSIAATYPYPGGNVYAGTKAFVRQFSLGLRSDLHGTGVRVTSIEPGLSETEFTLNRTGGDQSASDALYANANPIVGEDLAQIVLWIAALPAHLNVNTLELMPVSQSFGGFQIARYDG